jgi:DNA-nicking Smr family endonuclease
MTSRHRKSGALTPDEEHLWAHVTGTVHPMRRSIAERVADAPDHAGLDNASHSTPSRKAMPDLERIATPSAGKPRWQPLITQPTPRPKSAPGAQPHFDRRQAKKIATGKIEIEGRLDLHGLRESEAHVRLRGFLRQAQAQGKRTVLVITGKGRDSDDPHAPFDFGHERAPRGILKRNVPRWLAEPEIAPLVVSYTTAHTRHGGDGALYVHLRRAG